MDRLFSKDMQMTNKYSSTLATKDMQIKTTVRFHFIPTTMPIIERQKITRANEDVEKLKCSYIVK